MVNPHFEPPEHVPRPRPGPRLASWCSGGLLACPGAEGTTNDLQKEEKKSLCAKDNTIMNSNIPGISINRVSKGPVTLVGIVATVKRTTTGVPTAIHRL